MKRGEIYYIEKYRYDAQGSEQAPGRPAIIVSNDKCNMYSEVVEIVYLTTSPKTDLPTHIDIRSAQRQSIALCEQITSVSVDRIGDYIGQCSEYEMFMVDAALVISLGLNFDEPKKEALAKVEKKMRELLVNCIKYIAYDNDSASEHLHEICGFTDEELKELGYDYLASDEEAG